MIDWKKYFDHIFCIHYISKDRIDRHNKLIDELIRVGIYNSGIFSFIYDEDSLLTNTICNNFPVIFCENAQQYAKRVTINHYKALSISNILNYKHILILEDDIVFLKDLQFIENMLIDSQNKDFDICKYDSITYTDNDLRVDVLATCYSVRNEGIKKLIKNIEHAPTYVIDMYFANKNNYIWILGNNKYDVSFPQTLSIYNVPYNIAMQRENKNNNIADFNI